jgi:hypothetical protein
MCAAAVQRKVKNLVMCAAAAQRKVKNLVDPIPYIIIIIINEPPSQTIPKIMFPKAYFKTEFQTTQTLQLIIIILIIILGWAC